MVLQKPEEKGKKEREKEEEGKKKLSKKWQLVEPCSK